MRGTQFKRWELEAQIDERRRRTARRRGRPGAHNARASPGKAIMRMSVGKWERSQNFPGKHGTIYCFHIRRRVLQSWMQFVNPLSRSAAELCGAGTHEGRGRVRGSRDVLHPAGNLAVRQRSVFLLLANGEQTHRSVFIARKAFIVDR